MNKVQLIGRLTREPELKYTSNNIPVTTFSLAVNRSFTSQNGEREADFINIVVWRKQAENVKNYVHQGSLIAVDGRIQTRSYDAADGSKRYVTEVVADNVEFLESKSQSEARVNKMNNSDKNQTEEVTNVESDPFESFGSTIDISDDDLPF